MNFAITLLLILCLPLTCLAGSGSKVEQFLASRSVVGQVYFAKQDSHLDDVDKVKLATLAVALKKLPWRDKLLRVEGFASPEGGITLNVDLSMQRALAVKNFLQQYDLPVELFLTGFGENPSTAAKLAEQRRVDIAAYEINRATAVLFQKADPVERFIIR